jgi:hypothetical protein
MVMHTNDEGPSNAAHWHKRATEAEVRCEVLRNDLDTALGMLADWCVAVDVNGTGWDDWDKHYKDAMYRDGPLRAMLDKAIAEARTRRG